MHTRQYPCPGGTYTSSETLTASNQCSNCDSGYYCPEGSYRMRDCPPGYFCITNTANYLDSPCPAGKYRPAPRGRGSGDCSACPGGHYCLAEVAAPIPCPAGTFSTGDATTADYSKDNANSCTICTAGKFCPHAGIITPYDCGEGFYSQAGAQECVIC